MTCLMVTLHYTLHYITLSNGFLPCCLGQAAPLCCIPFPKRRKMMTLMKASTPVRSTSHSTRTGELPTTAPSKFPVIATCSGMAGIACSTGVKASKCLSCA